MLFQPNPFAIILIIGIVPQIIVFFILWRRGADHVTRLFLLMQFLGIGLVLTYAAELFSADLSTVMVFAPLKYLFHFLALAALLFAAALCGFGQFFRRPFIVAAAIPFVIANILVWTNDYHQLIWIEPGIREAGGFVYFASPYGWGYWLYFVYAVACSLAAVFLLLYRMAKVSSLYRWQLGFLVVGLLMPFIGLFLRHASSSPLNMLNLAPFGFAFSSIPFGIALVRYRLLDVIPIAYHNILDSIADSVFVCDARLRVLDLNKSAWVLCGGEVGQFEAGQPLSQMLPGVAARVQTLLQDKHDAHSASDLFHDAAGRVFDLRVFALMSSLRGSQQWIIMLHDISVRRRMEQAQMDLAIERERVHILESFVRDISHDFRTPLSTVTSAISLVRMRATSLEEKLNSEPNPAHADSLYFLEYLQGKGDYIETGIWRISNLVDQMLEMTRLDSKQSYNMTPTGLLPLAQAVLSHFADLCAQKLVTVCFDHDADLPDILADPNEIRLAIHCLIENACHYTPRGGEISVRVHQDQHELVIDVQDTGIGIAPQHQPHIFERLYRADEARRTHTGGSGLGLSIARAIVEAHQGALTFISAVGEGSTFTIRLPLADSAATASQ